MLFRSPDGYYTVRNTLSLHDALPIFAEIRSTEPDFRAEVVVRLEREPFEARGHEALWEALDGATREVLGAGLEAAGENAWMDAALMQSAGIPTVSVGATGGAFHAPDEWVSLPELVATGELLERAIRRYCG